MVFNNIEKRVNSDNDRLSSLSEGVIVGGVVLAVIVVLLIARHRKQQTVDVEAEQEFHQE